MKTPGSTGGRSASELISRRIAALGDWRGEALARIRKLIRQADPDIVEECKWRGTPVWSDTGIICTGESYRHVVKLTFAKGALLKDPAGLFNASLDGKVRRAIDIREGESVDASAFKALVRQARAVNRANPSNEPTKTRRQELSLVLPKRAPGARTSARILPTGRAHRAGTPSKVPRSGLDGWITHTELASLDPAATKAWCASVLGWTFRPSAKTPGGEYHLFSYSEAGGGGIRAVGPSEVPGAIPYVRVADVQRAFDSAVRAGAAVMMPPERVMADVTIAIVRAPGGVPIGFSGP